MKQNVIVVAKSWSFGSSNTIGPWILVDDCQELLAMVDELNPSVCEFDTRIQAHLRARTECSADDRAVYDAQIVYEVFQDESFLPPPWYVKVGEDYFALCRNTDVEVDPSPFIEVESIMIPGS